MVRNREVTERKDIHLGVGITVRRIDFETFDESKNRWDKRFIVSCVVDRTKQRDKPINLGECNDGSKFTSINQAVNQAKEFLDICFKYNW
jgi:hypothetical protein